MITIINMICISEVNLSAHKHIIVNKFTMNGIATTIQIFLLL